MPQFSALWARALLTIAMEAVEAGAEVLSDFLRRNSPLQLRFKGPTDYLTAADTAVEKSILHHLQRRFPRHRYLAEEGAGEGGGAFDLDNPRPLWILDPIDGTANFAHGFPHYCISLAQWADGQVQLAVVRDPVRGETFVAERGGGARLGRGRIRGSGQKGLQGALLANSTHSSKQGYGFDNLAALRRLYRNDLVVRRTGSAVLDLAYVAAGRLDGFWGNGLQPWDMAAGVLLLQEAGCLVGDFRGHPDPLRGDHILGAAPGCYAPLLADVSACFQDAAKAPAAEGASAAKS